jgi:PEGA domain-containing protein
MAPRICRWAFVLLMLISTFMMSGCVYRQLVITSDPPGATVLFNERERGKTPAKFDFQWYWKHRVELRLEGYESIDAYEKIKAPIYLWFPLDLVSEMMPFPIKDYRTLHYELKERELIDIDKL